MDSSVHSIEYWQRLSERYRRQRNMAVREIQSLQKQLYLATGYARDGNDYLRQIRATRTNASVSQRIKNLFKVLA